MRRPRKGAKSPPAARHPRKRPPIEAILAERGIVRATLRGVPARDRADVEAEVFLAAWKAVRRGKYRPDPRVEPRVALRAWLRGISWRQASKYFESAWARRAILHAEPLGLLRGVVGPSLDAQVEARDLLRAIERLEPRHQEILLTVDAPETLAAYAAQRGMSQGTAASRLRIAKLRRWRR
ncbi:hypothetical protein BE20_03480 [Sorangium cellulosum]|nr:hypothetical protein BE20_03480 [Sorangium cellulosum]